MIHAQYVALASTRRVILRRRRAVIATLRQTLAHMPAGRTDKSGRSALGNTADGKQGSQSWIRESDRLEKAVGDSIALDIRLAIAQPSASLNALELRPLSAHAPFSFNNLASIPTP